MRNSGAAIFLLPVFLVFAFVYLCLPLFAFVYLPLFLLSKIPHCPHCLVFDRVLSEFTRSTRFPSFLLPLSSYHSLPPTTLPPTTLFLLLCTVSSSYHSHSVLSPLPLPLPLCTTHSVPPTPPTPPTLLHPLLINLPPPPPPS